MKEQLRQFVDNPNSRTDDKAYLELAKAYSWVCKLNAVSAFFQGILPFIIVGLCLWYSAKAANSNDPETRLLGQAGVNSAVSGMLGYLTRVGVERMSKPSKEDGKNEYSFRAARPQYDVSSRYEARNEVAIESGENGF